MNPATPPPPHVMILMAVYNGARFLEAQLSSIAAQSHSDWNLLISDDGSTDASRDILTQAAKDMPNITCLNGPGQGGTANFMSLICAAADHAPADSWIAFSDQDDVWLPTRLERGIAALQIQDPDQPALYCSRTWITDETLSTRSLSAARPRPLGFRNALVQNVASGNTILLNAAAARLVMQAAQETTRPVVHDWWIYQLISGAGGALVHDDTPSLLYRQHGVNQIGANMGHRARLRRIGMLLSGHFRDWNDTNLAALRCSAHRLTVENRALLEQFAAIRMRAIPARVNGIRRLGLYRQSPLSTLALWLAAAAGRL